ncbi:MAG TPA: hypothetical protein DDW30_04935 [Clostridiales bacterium]|nr:hypothetical protein [Clostridiales bacterium]
MNLTELKQYKRDALLGALGAFLMLVGDLCLSVISASPNDSGLFVREAYLNGSWERWRLPLLLATGLCGMALGFFTVRVFYRQIRPQYRKTRLALLVGGVIYIATAGALHLWIGSLADWTTTLAPLLGREETVALIQAQYDRLMPAMLIAYAGMVLLILTSAFAVLTKKTVLPRWMLAVHMIVFQLVFVLIPDIRQALGAEVSTWDFVLSQGSGNAALCLWMLANAVWSGREARMGDGK